MATPRAEYYHKDDELLRYIGERLRAHREAMGQSIEKLANECDVDYSQVARMERGELNFGISQLYRLLRALNINWNDVLPPVTTRKK